MSNICESLYDMRKRRKPKYCYQCCTKFVCSSLTQALTNIGPNMKRTK